MTDARKENLQEISASKELEDLSGGMNLTSAIPPFMKDKLPPLQGQSISDTQNEVQ